MLQYAMNDSTGPVQQCLPTTVAVCANGVHSALTVQYIHSSDNDVYLCSITSAA
jgi:hypothetical protein